MPICQMVKIGDIRVIPTYAIAQQQKIECRILRWKKRKKAFFLTKNMLR
jgi:hypothetical protein